MKGLTKFQILLTGLGIIFLALGLHLFRIWNMILDFRAINSVASSPPSAGPPKRKPLLPFVTGLTTPPGFTRSQGEFVSRPFPCSPIRKTVPDSEIRKAVASLPEGFLGIFQEEQLARVDKCFGNLPSPASPPEYLDIQAPRADLQEYGETAHLWYCLGRHMSGIGKKEEALSAMGGILLIAHLVECDCPEGMWLILKLIGNAIRKIGATGFLEIAQDIDLPEAILMHWVRRLVELDARHPSVALAFQSERALIPSLVNERFIDNWSKSNPGVRPPHSLASALRNKAFQEEYLSLVYDPAIKACSMPFADAVIAMASPSRILEDLQQRTSTPGLLWGTYFFHPSRFFMEFLVGIFVPNMRKALVLDFQCRQITRGAMGVLALGAFRSAKGRLPSDLKELESWMGFPLPEDLYSRKPLIYSPGSKDILSSVGPDGASGTADDLVFLPLPNIP